TLASWTCSASTSSLSVRLINTSAPNQKLHFLFIFHFLSFSSSLPPALTLPSGYFWTSDFGCADNKEDFEYLIKYSPLHTVIPKGEQQWPVRPSTRSLASFHSLL